MSNQGHEPGVRMAIGHLNEALRYAERLPGGYHRGEALKKIGSAIEHLQEYAAHMEIELRGSMRT